MSKIGFKEFRSYMYLKENWCKFLNHPRSNFWIFWTFMALCNLSILTILEEFLETLDLKRGWCLSNFHQLFTEITFDIIWYSQLIGDEVSSFSRSKENLINFRQIDSLLTLWINHLATFTVDIVSECFKLKENVGINLQSKHWKSVNILSTWDLRRLYFYISHVHF